ncbi:MAG TPA: UDP-N-acetylenolpyruvoylglucosamine reductase [Lachnospiraceae bacterium]|nr:UDP-N-acetylenolpyruvoylglucosamine reductase [Lachnospiraceae bacterium]
MRTGLKEEICRLAGDENVRENESLAGYTTFRTGGRAELLVSPWDMSILPALTALLRREKVPFIILGKGSNVLVGDRGFKGAVIRICENHGRTVPGDEDTVIRAQSGAGLMAVSRIAMESGLSGMEFASGIPGTVGGAMVMNAGAYGGEMKQIVEAVTVFDIEAGAVRSLSCEEMAFGYRDSVVRHKPYIVLEAAFKLEHGDRACISEKMEELRKKRFEKQPLEYPSAGSTFKRPEGHYAGKLIEDSGLKGYSVGGAQVSEKHCGFVINKSGASSLDIKRLIEDVQRIVYEKQGIRLETEVLMIGDFE